MSAFRLALIAWIPFFAVLLFRTWLEVGLDVNDPAVAEWAPTLVTFSNTLTLTVMLLVFTPACAWGVVRGIDGLQRGTLTPGDIAGAALCLIGTIAVVSSFLLHFAPNAA